MYNSTVISPLFIITLLSHLSHTYRTLQFFLNLIIKHCPYDNIIYIITFITIIHIIIVSIPEIVMNSDEGSCMGIELNIWERMKVSKLFYVYRPHAYYMHYLHYIYII